MEERKLVRQIGQSNTLTHNIIMENRTKVSISGVEDVDSFDEETVILYTSHGLLTVKGNEFRINKLNVESGEVMIEGDIDSLIYSTGDRHEKGGFFSKMFK